MQRVRGEFRYLFVPASAQGQSRIVRQAGRDGVTHGVMVRQAVHGVRMDAVITHGRRRRRRSHCGRNMAGQRNAVRRLRLGLPRIEGPHAREGRARTVGIRRHRVRVHVRRGHGRHADRRIGRRARVGDRLARGPGRWLCVGHVGEDWCCGGAVVLRGAGGSGWSAGDNRRCARGMCNGGAIAQARVDWEDGGTIRDVLRVGVCGRSGRRISSGAWAVLS